MKTRRVVANTASRIRNVAVYDMENDPTYPALVMGDVIVWYTSRGAIAEVRVLDIANNVRKVVKYEDKKNN